MAGLRASVRATQGASRGAPDARLYDSLSRVIPFSRCRISALSRPVESWLELPIYSRNIQSIDFTYGVPNR